MKLCSRCGQNKAVEAFGTDRSKRDGHTADCKECRRKVSADYKRRNPERVRGSSASHARLKGNLRRYGVTYEEYLKTLAYQNGGCAICGAPPQEGKRLSIDHNHECCPYGSACQECVRGALCDNCNTGIGLLKDDPKLMLAAIDYLERGGTWQR